MSSAGPHHEPAWRQIIGYALADGIPRRSLAVALVVGSVLNLINQGDVLWGTAHLNWLKLGLTYLVPYAVSTYGAVAYKLSLSRHAASR